MTDIFREIEPPRAMELALAYAKLKWAARTTPGMTLDSIEYNPNYVGLFAHVWYGGQRMKFLISYNHLLTCESKWISGQLERMAREKLKKI